jgi:hypothetical protein
MNNIAIESHKSTHRRGAAALLVAFTVGLSGGAASFADDLAVSPKTAAPATAVVAADTTKAVSTVNTTSGEVDLNDSKVTAEEKKLDKKNAAKSDKYVNEQANVANKVPGVHVDAKDLKETDVHKSGGFPNPISWMLKPVTRLQEQSVRLEQEIMKLTGPIGSMQPAMLNLDKRMTSVEKQMGSMQGELHKVRGDMDGVTTEIQGARGSMGEIVTNIKGMRNDLGGIKGPISELREPVVALRGPVLGLAKPLQGVEARLNNLDSQLNQLKLLLSLVLTSIFAAAAIVAIGTPLAAIWVWRNRHKFINMTKAEQAHEDRQLEKVGASIGKE